MKTLKRRIAWAWLLAIFSLMVGPVRMVPNPDTREKKIEALVCWAVTYAVFGSVGWALLTVLKREDE